jgi:WD40 repeat protein
LKKFQIPKPGSYGDGTIKLWNWSTGECLSTIQTPGSFIRSLVVINFDQQQQKESTTIPKGKLLNNL